jgi:hypothetical protein
MGLTDDFGRSAAERDAKFGRLMPYRIGLSSDETLLVFTTKA